MFAKLPLSEQLDAWLGRDAHTALDLDAEGDLVVHGAVVDFHPCVVVAFDYAKAHGSIGPDEAEQISEALEIAGERNVPLVFFMNTSGMRVTEGLATVDALRRLLRNVLDAKLVGQRMFAIVTRNVFGGASALASLCERRAMNADAVLAMSGPKLIEKIAGADVFSASDAAAVRALIGGEARAAVTETTQLCDDTPKAYRAVLSEWLTSRHEESDDFLLDWAQQLRTRLGARALPRPAAVPATALDPVSAQVVHQLLGRNADIKGTGNVLDARASRAGAPVVVGLVGGVDATAPSVLALAEQLLRIAHTPTALRIVVLADSPSHSVDPADERVVLSEYLSHLALSIRFAHDEGHEVDVVVTGTAGGGIFATLAAGATRVLMRRDARVQVLPPDALAAIGKQADPDDETLYAALDAGVVDATFPDA